MVKMFDNHAAKKKQKRRHLSKKIGYCMIYNGSCPFCGGRLYSDYHMPDNIYCDTCGWSLLDPSDCYITDVLQDISDVSVAASSSSEHVEISHFSKKKI